MRKIKFLVSASVVVQQKLIYKNHSYLTHSVIDIKKGDIVPIGFTTSTSSSKDRYHILLHDNDEYRVCLMNIPIDYFEVIEDDYTL